MGVHLEICNAVLLTNRSVAEHNSFKSAFSEIILSSVLYNYLECKAFKGNLNDCCVAWWEMHSALLKTICFGLAFICLLYFWRNGEGNALTTKKKKKERGVWNLLLTGSIAVLHYKEILLVFISEQLLSLFSHHILNHFTALYVFKERLSLPEYLLFSVNEAWVD